MNKLVIERVAAVLRQHGALTVADIMRHTGHCHTTVHNALRDSRFRRVGTRNYGAPGRSPMAYDLAEQVPPPVAHNPIVEQALADQAVLAKAIRTLSRRGHQQAALDMAKVWLAEDASIKRSCG